MNVYQNGKVYKMVPIIPLDPADCYIGSTINKYLCNRKAHHICVFNKHMNSCSVIKLFEKYGTENVMIILLETYPCNSKDELRAREEYWRTQIPNINARSCHKRDPVKRRISQIRFQQNQVRVKRTDRTHCELCDSDILTHNLHRHNHSRNHLKNIVPDIIDGPADREANP